MNLFMPYFNICAYAAKSIKEPPIIATMSQNLKKSNIDDVVAETKKLISEFQVK